MTENSIETPAAKELLTKGSGFDQGKGNDRIKQITHRLLMDLFRAIEDFDVPPDEVWAAARYLTTLGQANEVEMLIAGLGIEAYLDIRMDAAEHRAGITGGTPRTIEGPHYIAGAPLSEGYARLDDGKEDGEVLLMSGQVRGADGRPLAGAIVDVWHANSLGGYSFFDPSQKPYNLRRRIQTDVDGRYRFRSILPSCYGCPPEGPAQQLFDQLGRHGQRPAHIHFIVTAPGYRKLTTQTNIDGDKYLREDCAFATRDGLIPKVHRHKDPTKIRDHGFDGPYTEIIFDFVVHPETQGLPSALAHLVRVETARNAVRLSTPWRLDGRTPRYTNGDAARTAPTSGSGMIRTHSRSPYARLEPDLAIVSVNSTIVDVPLVRRHKFSSRSVAQQSYVIVELQLANGVIGIGEAATLGGLWSSEESVESIKATIDGYLAPAILDELADRFEMLGARMNAAAKRNNAAKAAIETALFDAVGKSFDVPATALLGGVVRDRIPVFWTLASGDPAQEIDEAEAKLSARLHNNFKVKVGAQTADNDLVRLSALAEALDGRARLIVDANQAWDESTAARCLPALADLEIALVEQPVPAWNVEGMARLRSRAIVPLMADECVFSANEMAAVARAAAADVVSLKLVKHGGPLNTRKVAAVAEAAGVGLYGGSLLESSIGAAAHLHVFASLGELTWGCEHFGPQILVEDLVTEPLRFEGFHIHLPIGPGLGVTLDHDKLRRFART